jgi:ornithine--oxo-acid transaminase
MLAFDHEQVRPDVVALGKALSGGMMPVSGVLCDDYIMSLIGPGDHGCTYGGNPLAMAIAKTAMEVIVEEGLCENATKMGNLFISELNRIKSPLIKEVRGRGLFVGIEIKKGEGIHVDGNHFAKQFFANGVLTKATHD